MKKLASVFFLTISLGAFAQKEAGVPYWNSNTQLLPWRMTPTVTGVQYVDIDKDGDPDVLKAMLNGVIPIMWIDDDDDMKKGDTVGDTDNDCLLIDKNNDKIFAGPQDFSIDWNDEDKDGKADIQLIVNNTGTKRNFYDWSADFMYVLDDDKDNIMHYVDWNKIMMQAWEHNGHANFFKDYHGNTTFLKMHAASFRIDDLRYNWENPFIFYDFDGDKLSEMAIRLLDIPVFRDTIAANNVKNGFDKLDKEIDIKFSKKITYAALTWDLDNDNGAGNELDFDMSLLFKGKGFDYQDQKHYFKSLTGLPGTNKFLFDSRWRTIDTLFYPDRHTAPDLIYNRGDWQETWFVFDEDDDCNRWERVEFYEPRDLFAIGKSKGGLDHNPQADALGDRGEFDLDNSGKGQLYVGVFDGRVHLYGSEWGAWRIDQTAYAYQGFGGLYDRWRPNRIERESDKFATVKYSDTDKNGFLDVLEYDLDGDKIFEDRISLIDLGIDDKATLINTGAADYNGFSTLFKSVSDKMWSRALKAVELGKKHGIDPFWYAFYLQPHSAHERYDFGYWLNFYIYQDLRHLAKTNHDKAFQTAVDKAYYSGNWDLLDHVSLKKVKK
jgi:hypothetical protein